MEATKAKTPDINKMLARDNVSSRYGAPMGRADSIDFPELPLWLQRVKFVDGDYDAGGAYWGGGGTPLWCAFGDGAEHRIRVFVRADSREEAKQAVREVIERRTGIDSPIAFWK